MHTYRLIAALLALVLAACDSDGDPDAGAFDAGPRVEGDAGADGDAGLDAGPGPIDSGMIDAGPGTGDGGTDAGPSDGGMGIDGGADAGPGMMMTDAGPGMTDAGPGMTDAGPGMTDAGPGMTDAGPGMMADAGPPPTGGTLYSCAQGDGNLRTLNVTTGATLTTTAMMMGATAVSRCNGMARHPTTGVTFIVARFVGSMTRTLATVDLSAGAVTMVGPLTDNFASIAFDGAGTLYGVTGDGATTSETLYTIDTTTGVSTLAVALGNGDDGEAIGFNPTDGLIYHASGLGMRVLETLNPAMITTAPLLVPLSGFDYGEATALTWDPVGSAFFVSSIEPELSSLSTTGVGTLLGGTDHQPKGLVFVP